MSSAMKRIFVLSICSVLLAVLCLSCKKDMPGQESEPETPVDPPIEVDYVFKENVQVFDETFFETVKEIDSDLQAIYFTGERPCQGGQILVCNTPTEQFPNGMLIKVSSTFIGGIRYRPASIEETFDELTIDNVALPIANHVAKVVDADGKELKYTPVTKAVSTSDEISMKVSGLTWDLAALQDGEDSPVALKATFSPELGVSVKMRFQAIVDEGELLAMNVLADTKLDFDGSIEAFGEVAIQQNYKLFSIYFTPIPVGPIVLVPKIDIVAFVKVDGKVGIEGKLSYSKRLSIGAGYETGDWRTILRGLEDEESEGDPEKQFFTFKGNKMEGGFSVGLKPSLDCRLYDIFGCEIELETAVREAISTKFDAETGIGLTNAKLSTGLSAKAKFALNAKIGEEKLFETFDYVTPEWSTTLDETAFMPEASDVVMTPYQDGIRLTGKLSRKVFDKPIMVLNVWDDKGMTREVPINWTKPKNNEEKTDFEVTLTGLEPKQRYNWNVTMNVFGIDALVPGIHYTVQNGGINCYNSIQTVDFAEAEAVLEFMKKFSATVGWNKKGCGWEDLEARDVYKYATIGKDMSYVCLRPGWNQSLPETLVIPDISSSLKDNTYWYIDGYYEDNDGGYKGVRNIVCNDPKFTMNIAYASHSLESIEIHSPKFGFHSGLRDCYVESPVLTKLDLSGCNAIKEIEVRLTSGKTPEIKLENCTALEDVTLTSKDFASCPQIQNKGCENLYWVRVYKCLIPKDLELVTDPVGCIELYDPICPKLTAPLCKTLRVDDHENIELSVVNNPVFESIRTHNGGRGVFKKFTLSNSPAIHLNPDGYGFAAKEVVVSNQAGELNFSSVEKITVSNCPSASYLRISGNFPYENVSISGVDALRGFSIHGGTGYTGEVYPFMPEIIARGGRLDYDVRYTYKYNSTTRKYEMETDNGYGLYYSGEPGTYHEHIMF